MHSMRRLIEAAGADRRQLVKQVLTDLLQEWITTRGGPFVRSAYAINTGPCAEFADDAVEALGEHGINAEVADIIDLLAERGQDLPNYYHYAVKVGDRFYDAQCLDGVDNFMYLPFMREHGRYIRPIQHDDDGNDEEYEED